MPTDSGYAIAEIASLAGVTPRTIRYYVSVGLIPPPEQAGRGARYDEDHLRRIRLIRRLQDQHLPLSAIRSRITTLSEEEVAATLATADSQPVGTALDYIRSLTTAPPRWVASPSQPYLEEPAAPAPAHSLPIPGPTPSAAAKPVAAMWERIPLTTDVELHVRRPLGRTANRRVERLITIAREILEDQS